MLCVVGLLAAEKIIGLRIFEDEQQKMKLEDSKVEKND